MANSNKRASRNIWTVLKWVFTSETTFSKFQVEQYTSSVIQQVTDTTFITNFSTTD